MVNILVADDHPIIRRGVKQILSETSDLVVADEAENGNEVLDKVRKKDFDIVILDLSMPGISWLDILKQIRKEKPGVRTLILSRYPEEQYAVPALKAGAFGYVSKTSIVDELINALRKIATGKEYVSPSLAQTLASQIRHNQGELQHAGLSDREHEIMVKLASGQKVSEIAKELCLSPTTISTYRHRIMVKMGLENDAELTRYAIDHELI